ncbi:MAG: hypothetical protein JNK53_03615 [Phycisphaerae bacterium]|nr:hypothetical protein [Phycisphaerae bacterium]
MDPELPTSPLLVRFFAEHPWSVVAPLLLVGAALAWYGARNDRIRLVMAGVAALLLAAGTLVSAAMWRSPGEHAAEAIRQLVAHAEAGDVAGVWSSFGSDATIHYGTREAPGFELADIRRAAESLAAHNRIESNTVTELGFATIDDDTAEVMLGCRTTTHSSYVPIVTRWWMQVRRQPDGRWLIERMAFLQFGNQRPSRGTI